MTIKKTALLVAVLAVLGLAGCSEPVDLVDGKGTSPVPGTTVTCYWLEVETTTAADEDVAELTYCASKAEWDRNRVGQRWVDAAGNPR